MAEYSFGVSDRHIGLYRKKAEACRQQADNSLNFHDKEAWLRLAQDWTLMAQEVEQRLTGIKQARYMENTDRAQIVLRAHELSELAGMPDTSSSLRNTDIQA